MVKHAGPHAISLPILIPCFNKGEDEGQALFHVSPRWNADLLRLASAAPVRRFTDGDFTDALKLMGDGETKRFIALRVLQTAIVSKQREDIKAARKKLCAALASDCKKIESSFRPEEKGRQKKKHANYEEGSLMGKMARMFEPCDLADEAKIMTERYLTEDPVLLFAAEMSGAMKNVQLVLWRSGTSLIPAFYATDHAAAAYATAFFGRRWKVCPYSGCGKWFISNRADKEYCCAAHRDAHRVARWREQQKAKSKHH